jgi:hypothetical protein
MRVNAYPTSPESLASKRFRSSSANDDQSQLEFSGFGVRVPGGAQSPGHASALGFLLVLVPLKAVCGSSPCLTASK